MKRLQPVGKWLPELTLLLINERAGVPTMRFDSKTCFLQNKMGCSAGTGAVSPVFSLWDPFRTGFLVLFLEPGSESCFSARLTKDKGAAGIRSYSPKPCGQLGEGLGVCDAGLGHNQLDPTRWGPGALSRKVGILALQMKRLHSPCRPPLCNDEHPHFCLEQACHLYRLIPT